MSERSGRVVKGASPPGFATRDLKNYFFLFSAFFYFLSADRICRVLANGSR